MHVFHNFHLFFAIVILEMSCFLAGIQIPLENIFVAMNLKKTKDDYSENFAEAIKKYAKWNFVRSNWKNHILFFPKTKTIFFLHNFLLIFHKRKLLSKSRFCRDIIYGWPQRTMKKTQLDSTRLEKSRVLLEFKMIRGSLQGYGVKWVKNYVKKIFFEKKMWFFQLERTIYYFVKMMGANMSLLFF